MKESVLSLKEKTTQHWFSYFQIAHKYKQSFMTDPLNRWSPSQTDGFPPGTLVSYHMKTIRTQTSVPTSMINISCITCFIIVVK